MSDLSHSVIDISDWVKWDEADKEEKRRKKADDQKEMRVQVDSQPPRIGVREPEVERPKFTFTHIADLVPKCPEYWVYKRIETDSLGFIVGAPGSFKSFYALALALCVASGTPFYGSHVRQGTVFYIAAEGHNGLANRVDAWARKNGVDRHKMAVFTSDRGARFLDKESAADVMNAILELAAIYGPPALIVVDTLARNLGSGDENSTADMSAFITAMDDLRSNWSACTIIVVHHTGWDARRRGRGSSVAFGAMDFEYILERKKGEKEAPVCVFNTKMKEAAEREDEWFALEVIDLGFVDEDGEPVSSGVLMSTKGGNDDDASAKLGKNAKLALDAYVTAAAGHGVFGGEGLQGVSEADWRAIFYEAIKGVQPDSRSKTFKRAKDVVIEAGLIADRGGLYLVLDPTIVMEINFKRDRPDKADRTGQN